MTIIASPDDPHGVERLRAQYAAEDRPDPAAAIEELRLVLADGKRTIRDLRLANARLRAGGGGMWGGTGGGGEGEVMWEVTREAEPTDAELQALDDAMGPEDALLQSLRLKLALLVEASG